MKQTSFHFRPVYHRQHADAKRILFPTMDPVPVFVGESDVLREEDFLFCTLVGEGVSTVICLQLTPSARERVNAIAKSNQLARTLGEYTALLMYVDGRAAEGLTMFYEPIEDDLMYVRGLGEQQSLKVLEAVNGNQTGFS